MRDLIIGVVMDVISHLILNSLQRFDIGWVPMATWDFLVLDASEFVVLNPKVGFEYFQSRWETKQRRVSG